MDGSGVFASLFSLFSCMIGIGIVAAIVFALVHLLKKAKEQEVAAKLELQQLVRTVPRESQGAFMMYYNARKKTASTAVLLALLLGAFGAHKFYLEETGMGIVYFLFSWTGIPAIIAFIEAFTMSQKVTQLNRDVAREATAMLGGDIATPASFL